MLGYPYREPGDKIVNTNAFEAAAHAVPPWYLASYLALFPARERTPGMARIELSIEETPTEVVVRVAGEAGLQQTQELTMALLGLSARRPARVTLDLSGLSFVSSRAVRILVAFRRGVVRAGGRMRLAATLQEPVRAALGRAELLMLLGWPLGSEDAQGAAASPVLTPSRIPIIKKRRPSRGPHPKR